MNQLNEKISKLLSAGTVIPAHPLALNQNLKIDVEKQRRLTRYYIACGTGGVAVGVHTTQFEIRKSSVNLLETVYEIAAEEIDKALLDRPFIKVAGVCGDTGQALKEANLALKYGYHLGLLSLGGLNHWSEEELITHVKIIAGVIPVIGFYLQPAVGGRILSYDFWRQFADIPNIKAIKVAAFNRYQTLDVVRAVCASGRRNDIALYTGNDDHIVGDLLTSYKFNIDGRIIEKKFVGGLLGHWSVWAKGAVDLFETVKACVNNQYKNCDSLLSTGIEVTDMNAAIFDPKNNFQGCIPGIHEVLRRQGLLDGTWCLDPLEVLSAGQQEEIDRVCRSYPNLTDDAFVKEFLLNDSVSKDSLKLV